jgi:hypothetical protein
VRSDPTLQRAFGRATCAEYSLVQDTLDACTPANVEDLRRVVEEKASQAGVTPHEWARLAAPERDPPKRQVIPELNRDAWLEMARLMATLNGAVWRFQTGKEGLSGRP